MHQSGVVSDEEAAAGQTGVGGHQIDIAKQHRSALGRERAQQGLRHFALARTAEDQHGRAFKGAAGSGEAQRKLTEALDRPLLAEPVGGRCQSERGAFLRNNRRGAGASLRAGKDVRGQRRIRPHHLRKARHAVLRALDRGEDPAMKRREQPGDRGGAHVDHHVPRSRRQLSPQQEPVKPVFALADGDQPLKARHIGEEGSGDRSASDGEARLGITLDQMGQRARAEHGVANSRGRNVKDPHTARL